jgi:hypothetical protein
MAKNLEQINDKKVGKKLVLPPGFGGVMEELTQAVNEIVTSMPSWAAPTTV